MKTSRKSKEKFAMAEDAAEESREETPATQSPSEAAESPGSGGRNATAEGCVEIRTSCRSTSPNMPSGNGTSGEASPVQATMSQSSRKRKGPGSRGLPKAQSKHATAREVADERRIPLGFLLKGNRIQLQVGGIDEDYLFDGSRRQLFLEAVAIAVQNTRRDRGASGQWEKCCKQADELLAQEVREKKSSEATRKKWRSIINGRRLRSGTTNRIPNDENAYEDDTEVSESEDIGRQSAALNDTAEGSRDTSDDDAQDSSLASRVPPSSSSGMSKKRARDEQVSDADKDLPISDSSQKLRMTDAQRYPHLRPDHPAWDKTFPDANSLYTYILNHFTTYKGNGNKQLRHQEYPSYFNHKGFILTPQKLSQEVLELWIRNAEDWPQDA
ncbi:hypothetical protein PMZ80_010335 [Knufia obscura]|uniref:Uncharacterized protein n=1 Tax=Knufia obscura TaxID=1635080 RepID=A0ABR0RB11_9EURO|nr:hypothetical protein PMZ80_010335 [Knufia obscura]